MRKLKSLIGNKKAVSPVIGVILMVAITVAIAATVWFYVNGMTTSMMASNDNLWDKFSHFDFPEDQTTIVYNNDTVVYDNDTVVYDNDTTNEGDTTTNSGDEITIINNYYNTTTGDTTTLIDNSVTIINNTTNDNDQNIFNYYGYKVIKIKFKHHDNWCNGHGRWHNHNKWQGLERYDFGDYLHLFYRNKNTCYVYYGVL